MMPGPRVHTTPPTTMVIDPPLAARLSMKSAAPTTGYVDGAWWPRSRDLAAELPALLATLTARSGSGVRVAYNLTAWDTAARRVEIDGNIVRLEGFRSQDEQVVSVSRPDQQRISLLVIPPETPRATALRALMTASQRGNSDSIGDLLASSDTVPARPIPASRDGQDGAQARWEADGGRVYERG
jgi:hypothetical protein